jgi:hypothetical protein
LRPFLGSIFKSPWILREVKVRRGRRGVYGLRQERDRGERRRGVKEDSFYCGPTG